MNCWVPVSEILRTRLNVAERVLSVDKIVRVRMAGSGLKTSPAGRADPFSYLSVY